MAVNRKLSFARQLAGTAQYTVYKAKTQHQLGDTAVQASHHLSIPSDNMYRKCLYTSMTKLWSQAKDLISEKAT